MNHENNITINDLLEMTDQSNWNTLCSASDFVQKKCGKTKRESGEGYFQHSLRVTKLIIEWGLPIEAIVASLIHEAVEDFSIPLSEIKNMFNSSVIKLVNTAITINKSIRECEELTEEERNLYIQAKSKEFINDKTLFIIIAERLDTIDTVDCYDKEKQLKEVQHAREILIPLVNMEESYMCLDKLEDLCFKIEHESEYNRIKKYIETYKEANTNSCDTTINLMKNAFLYSTTLDEKKENFPPKLTPLQFLISDFISKQRSTISIHRQIINDSRNIKKDFTKYLSKKYIAVYDFTLVFNDDFLLKKDMSMQDVFFKYFEGYLIKHNICILDYRKTTRGNYNYFLLCDDCNNLYRLFIRSKDSYIHYRLGNIVDSDKSITSKTIHINSKSKYIPMIKVFKRNGDECSIASGATVLDFAFMIHTDLGLHFKHAVVNGEERVGPEYVLSYGDQVEVIPDDTIKPIIQWFRYAKTKTTIDELINYFS